MKFFHKYKRCGRWIRPVLIGAIAFSLLLTTPVMAAVEELNLTPEERYELPIQSNDWENWPSGPSVYAESAIVMEASTGTILYAKNIDDQHYPASITKIMTVLLALENCDLDEEVTFSHNAVYSIESGSSSISRDEGEILTVEECLYGIMLESANDCSNAIAEHIAGTTEAFAELMNQKAEELGCTNTHFVNPHGLPDENHYTSAHDMALITREAIKSEKFRQISSTAHYTLRATNKKDDELYMNNHHYMISNYKTSKYVDDTVFAGKTGYTSVALNTLVTCATRNGMDLIVITMKSLGTGEKGVPIYTDTANLLDYAGENFHKVNISQNETDFTIGQNELFDTGNSIFGNTTPMIEMDTDGYVVLPVDVDFSEASVQLDFNDDSEDVLGTLSYTYAGQTIGSTDLKLASSDLQEFDFQKTGEEGEATETDTTDATAQNRLIKINLRVLGLVAAIIILVVIIVLVIRRLIKEYHLHVDLHFIKRWKQRADRNSFSSSRRRRYRSRKRNKKHWWKK
jgi:D-alanyl-D-alanine carboxypeptidase (penicillin-binding protein 5/6)